MVAELKAGMLPEAIARLRAHIWSVSEHLPGPMSLYGPVSCSCPKIRRAMAAIANPLPLASEDCVLLAVGIESHFEPA